MHSQKQKQGWKPQDNLEGVGSSKTFEIAASQPKHDTHGETLPFSAIQHENVEVVRTLAHQSMSQEEVAPTAANATQLDRQLIAFSPNHG